jgi:Protein of unknown function (DUF4240)
MISETDFWQVIARSRRGRTGTQAERLACYLETLSAAEVLSFEKRYFAVFGEAYTYRLWGAMYVIFGGCGDDTFMDARAGLIALGETKFRAALLNPDSLAKLEDPEETLLEGSEIGRVAESVYERLSGQALPPLWKSLPEVPTGTFPDEAEMPMVYPKLWKRFGGDV